MKNKIRIFLLIVIILFAPLLPKGFLRPSVSFTNYKNDLYVKSSVFFEALNKNKFVQLSNLDLKNLKEDFIYKAPVSLFTFSKDFFNPRVIKLVPKQRYYLDQFKNFPCKFSTQYNQALKSFFKTLDFKSIECIENQKKATQELNKSDIITFYFKGRSHKIPVSIIESYFINNVSGGVGINQEGFRLIHDILELPFSFSDNIKIDFDGKINHSFKNQIIDIYKLNSDLSNSKKNIDLEFVNPPIIKVENLKTKKPLKQISSVKTTFYGSGVSRVFNINKGVRDISTFSLLPGQTFSFNSAVGNVDKNSGYAEALVITSKGIVNGYGGGLCQVSTTFYRAALFNGLEIIERHPHSHAINYYSQVLGHGLDAAIYIGVKDLIFKNNFDYPIIFEPIVLGSELIINLYAEKGVDFTLSNFKKYDEVVDNTVKVEGEQNEHFEVIQNAIPGFKTTWELEFSNGIRQKVFSNYLPKPKVLKYN